MKCIKLLALVLLLCTLMACAAKQQNLGMPEFTDNKLEYNPPIADTWVLPNGIKVVFIPDPELPLISGTLYTRPGSVSLTKDMQTVAVATSSLMRTGGAGELTAQELDQTIKELSASISASISAENSAFSFSGLVSDRVKIFKLLADIVRRPRFEQARLNLWKSQTLDGIKRRIEDPATIASVAFTELLYPESVYGHVITSNEVEKVTVSTMQQLHKFLVRPDQAIFAVTGAIQKAELDKLIRANFADWQPLNRDFPSPPEIVKKPTPGIYLVERDLKQSTIQMGQLGIRRHGPDHMTAIVFNQILTGGMTGRLMNKLRVEQGLVYSVSGSVLPGIVEGTNFIDLQTKNSTALTSIEQAINVITQLQKVPPSETELEETNRYLSNSFIFKFASPGALVNRYALKEILGFPEDYDTSYLRRVAEINADRIQDFAKRLWTPKEFVIVVVGNKVACDQVQEASKTGSGSLIEGMPVYRAKFTEKLELLSK